LEKPSWLLAVEVRDRNLGCRIGVPTSITSAFEQFDSLIILEDDVVCHPLFFEFMDLALETFELNEDVFAVNSWNPLRRLPSENGNVFLSRHFSPWGWGTWKNRWARYDVNMSSFTPHDSIRELPTLSTYKLNYLYERLLKRKLIQCYEGYDTWDYQLMYTMWKSGAKVACSITRLSGNCGFDERATHTKEKLSFIDAEVYGNNWLLDIDRDRSSILVLNEKASAQIDYSIDKILFEINSKSKFAYFLWFYRSLKRFLGNFVANI